MAKRSLSQNINLCYAQGMGHFLRHFFTPHHSNNQRAKLLHNSSLFVIACLLLVGSFTVNFVKSHHQSVLGVSANISSGELLSLTNQARNAAGLSSLNLDSQLSQAAAGKAQDMFTNNYWAHISPSGTTPWDFIRGAGYNYEFAGENLARGYSTANDAMSAWIASPEHKANIMSPNYSDVGFAVAEGTLTGDSGTILIVEEFGRKASSQPVVQNPVPVQQAAAATLPTSVPQQQAVLASPTPIPSVTPSPSTFVIPVPHVDTLTQVTAKPLIDSKKTTKTLAVLLLGILIFVLVLDMIFVRQRKLIRFVGHNLDHILFFVTIVIIALLLGQGVIF